MCFGLAASAGVGRTKPSVAIRVRIEMNRFMVVGCLGVVWFFTEKVHTEFADQGTRKTIFVTGSRTFVPGVIPRTSIMFSGISFIPGG